jgi:hypothetical protein
MCVTQYVNILCKYWLTVDWQMTDPTSRQRGRPQMKRQKLSKKKRSLVKSPRLGSTPRLTYWLTVSCNVTLILTLFVSKPVKTCVKVHWENKRVFFSLPVGHFCQITTETGMCRHWKLLDNFFHNSWAVHEYRQVYGQTNKSCTGMLRPLESDDVS